MLLHSNIRESVGKGSCYNRRLYKVIVDEVDILYSSSVPMTGNVYCLIGYGLLPTFQIILPLPHIQIFPICNLTNKGCLFKTPFQNFYKLTPDISFLFRRNNTRYFGHDILKIRVTFHNRRLYNLIYIKYLVCYNYLFFLFTDKVMYYVKGGQCAMILLLDKCTLFLRRQEQSLCLQQVNILTSVYRVFVK